MDIRSELSLGLYGKSSYIKAVFAMRRLYGPAPVRSDPEAALYPIFEPTWRNGASIQR